MSRFDWTVRQDGKGLSLSTGAGFSMSGGRCIVETRRGRSSPSARERLGLAHQVQLKRLSGRAVEVWQDVRNTAADTLDIEALTLWDGVVDLEGCGWRLAHSELFKQERYFGGYSFYTNGFLASAPGLEGTFGLSEDTPFPGLFFTHPERGTVLVAVLSQERCKPVWILRRQGRAMALSLREAFAGIPVIPVKSGATFHGERWVMLSVPGDIRQALDEYFRILQGRMEFPGTDSILREAVLWGSWNYNLRPRGHGDIEHAYIAANARALKKMIPRKPAFVVVDDGYQRGLADQRCDSGWFASCLEIFHKDGQNPHDPRLFPKGMGAVAADIRKAGVQPALWMTPRLHRQSSLALAHPDWLVRVKGVDSAPSFIGRTAFLDYSVPEARDFTRGMWNTVFNEWGYSGVKMDFWTYPFEVPQVCYRNRDRTAIELRNLFLQDLRSFVPRKGFVFTGCVTSAGNPFLGRYVDAARSSSDIGTGNWSLLLNSASILTLTSLFFRRDAFLGDSDSIGFCPDATLDENRFWATLALFSGAVCEIGGDLTRLTAEQKQFLSTTIRFWGPSTRVWNNALESGLKPLPATTWVLERADGVWEAHLNPFDYPRQIRVSRAGRDLWTGAALKGDCFIPPHGARVFRR